MLKVMLKSFGTALTVLLTYHHPALGECAFPRLESPAPDEISCVGYGICEYTKKFVTDGIVPSEKWIALLGITAQEKFGPLKTANPDERRTMRQKVIEMIQAYGFCYQTEENKYLRMDDSTGLFTKSILRGKRIDKSGKSESDQSEYFNKLFGMVTPTVHKDLFVLDTLFDIDRDKDGQTSRKDWENLNVIQRQQQFKTHLDQLLTAPPTALFSGLSLSDIEDPSLKTCLSQIQRQINSSTAFAITKDKKFATNNEDLCKSLAKTCELGGDSFCIHTKKGPQTQPEAPEEIRRKKEIDAFMGQGAQ